MSILWNVMFLELPFPTHHRHDQARKSLCILFIFLPKVDVFYVGDTKTILAYRAPYKRCHVESEE